MPIFSKWTFSKTETIEWSYPNYWDVIALCLVLAVIVLFAIGAKQMTTPYQLGQVIPISLDPSHLPYYAMRSVLRMLIAMGFSLVFTLVVGIIAAKNPHAERIIIPVIDVLQSVPILGYLSIAVVFFIGLFPGSLFGPECAAIFVIFTSQVWNMTLSFYQSVRTVPEDLQEASRMFHLSSWQRFWRLEVPFAMPGLLWNIMMSMSASWFFVVASEAITVSHQDITLPGIGSYIALAVAQANMHAILYAIITMFIVILLYDQLLFRPLSQWTEKFKFEQVSMEEVPNSLLIRLFQNTRFFRSLSTVVGVLADCFVNFHSHRRVKKKPAMEISKEWQQIMVFVWYLLLTIIVIAAVITLGHFVFHSVTLKEALHVVFLGLITAMRVMSLIFLASLIWIPIGVGIGLHPRFANITQPIIQFLASFPVNLLYPLVVMLIVKYSLNVNIWSSPLMVLGTQWYIAFNVIAGTSTLPKDLRQVTSNLNVKGLLWWRRLIIPGIFPYYLTGAITAAGGSWNASIIAESLSWGDTHLEAVGLGAYITHYATMGDFHRLALGISVMSLYVLVINRLIWRPLYNLVKERYMLS